MSSETLGIPVKHYLDQWWLVDNLTVMNKRNLNQNTAIYSVKSIWKSRLRYGSNLCSCGNALNMICFLIDVANGNVKWFSLLVISFNHGIHKDRKMSQISQFETIQNSMQLPNLQNRNHLSPHRNHLGSASPQLVSSQSELSIEVAHFYEYNYISNPVAYLGLQVWWHIPWSHHSCMCNLIKIRRS